MRALFTLTALVGLSLSVHAQLGLNKAECDDLYVQDGQQTSLSGEFLYKENGLMIILHMAGSNDLLNAGCIEWLAPAGQTIAEKDVQAYAAANGLDWSRRIPVRDGSSMRWWSGEEEYRDPANENYHMVVYRSAGNPKAVQAFGISTRDANAYLLRKNILPARPPQNRLHDSGAGKLAVSLGMTRTKESFGTNTLPSDRADQIKVPMWYNHSFETPTPGEFVSADPVRFLATFTYKAGKVVAMEFDIGVLSSVSTGGQGEFTYADIALFLKTSGVNWTACKSVPDGEKWVGALRKVSWGDPNAHPKAYDLVKEFYDPAFPDVHVILGRLGYVGRGNQYPDLGRNFVRIEDRDGRATREATLGSESRLPKVKPADIDLKAEEEQKDNAQVVLDQALKNMTGKSSGIRVASTTIAAAPTATPIPAISAIPAATGIPDVWDFLKIPATHKECVIPKHDKSRLMGAGDINFNSPAIENLAVVMWTTKTHEMILAYQMMKYYHGGDPNVSGFSNETFDVAKYNYFNQISEAFVLPPGTHIFLERSFPDGTGLATWTDKRGNSHTTYISLLDL